MPAPDTGQGFFCNEDRCVRVMKARVALQRGSNQSVALDYD